MACLQRRVPDSVGEKRFHNWLSDVQDWAVSRNRFWGTPLPIWMSEDGEEVCFVILSCCHSSCHACVCPFLLCTCHAIFASEFAHDVCVLWWGCKCMRTFACSHWCMQMQIHMGFVFSVWWFLLEHLCRFCCGIGGSLWGPCRRFASSVRGPRDHSGSSWPLLSSHASGGGGV